MGTSRSPWTATVTACRVWAREWQRRWTRSSPNAFQSVSTLLLPQTPERIGEPSLLRRVSPANEHILRVEPRGFEPLTSAVQSQSTIIARVRGCSKIPANYPIRLFDASPLFAVVRMGWCTTGVDDSQRKPWCCALVQDLQACTRAKQNSNLRPTDHGVMAVPSVRWVVETATVP